MPTTLGTEYPTNWKGTPPHMLREDVPVWQRFQGKYSVLWKKLYLDVLVGGPFLSAEEEKDNMKRMWRYNNSKRLDALAVLENGVWIIEVTASPGLRALGQLLTYVSLWQDDDPLSLIETPVLVCETLDTDLISSAAKFGIVTYLLPSP